jgi:S1-C subfamily serine protease
MRKLAILGILLLLVASCSKISTVRVVEPTFSPEVVQKVCNHTLSVATVYTMDETEWNRRVANPKPGMIWKDKDMEKWRKIIPKNLSLLSNNSDPQKFLAYIGSATLLKNNYAITVSHLFSHGDNTTGRTIWAFKDGLDHAVECDLICRGDIDQNWVNDYAVIRLQEDLGLPGLKIAKTDPMPGDEVIFSGSVGGLAFFTRYGRITQLSAYFEVGDDGKLHLVPFGDLKFWIIYPSGPGDSGGSIKNANGEIIGIIYVGIEIYQEQYCFSNPLPRLWDFLNANNLTYLSE